jgi:SAM-dependent methyltransferase
MSATDYVLGTHDEEIARLGLQHRAWRSRALAAWDTGEFGSGQTVLDVGCGPGFAALDLAEVVGPDGRVVAIDKSERFLAYLDATCRERGIGNIAMRRADFDECEFPDDAADRAWCRWVLSFVKEPRVVLARVAGSLRPGGVIVLHEYFDYATWRTMPPSSEVEEFVSAVMASWRGNGGEPNVALMVPLWLEELGFDVLSICPIVNVVQSGHLSWTWLRTFIEVGRQRLVELEYLTLERAEAIWNEFSRLEATPGLRMMTPGVLEIIAARTA